MSDLQPPTFDRTLYQNEPGNPCPYCADDAWVVHVVRDDGAEEMAPCPFCRAGKRAEFSTVGKEGHGVFGPDGFWRGGSVSHIERIPKSAPSPAPEECKAALRAMRAQLGPGFVRTEPPELMELL